MKGFFRFSIALMTAPLLCGAALVVAYVMLVVLTIPQLPAWAQPGVEQWLFDIPQYAETSDNGSYGNSLPSGMSAVPFDGYVGPGSDIYGLPLIGPIPHWGDIYDKPLLGCKFQDPLWAYLGVYKADACLLAEFHGGCQPYPGYFFYLFSFFMFISNLQPE